MSASWIYPEIIVFRLEKKLGSRQTHNVDSYENIEANKFVLKVAKAGYIPLWIEKQPMQSVAQFDSTVCLR